MNIWIFTPILDRYGASGTVIDLAHFAAINGLNVTIFAPKDYVDSSVLTEIESTNRVQVKILDLPIFRRGLIYSLKSLVRFFFTYLQKSKKIKAELDILPKPDLIHFATLATASISWISYPGAIKNLSVHESPRNYFEKKILNLISVRFFDAITYCSSFIRKEFGDLEGQVIYSGIDISKFKLTPWRSNHTNEVTRIVCVGRLNGWKGQDLLLESLSILKENGFAFTCDFIGSTLPGEEFYLRRLQEISDKAHLSNIVQFLGEVVNVHESLGSYDILVLPSIIPEPFGKVVIEGLSAKCLVVAPDEGGPCEVISHLDNGLLFEARNAKSLSETISWAIENPEDIQRMRMRGFNDRLKFSRELTSKQYLDLWLSLIESEQS